MRLDPEHVKQQITALIIQYPELEEDEQLRADMIEGVTDVPVFLKMIEDRRKEAVALSAGTATVIADLESRLSRFERREQAMRALIMKIMNHADLRKLELPEATFFIRQGSPRVIVVDEQEIPDDFCRFKREPNKTVIKTAIEGGANVPGAALSNSEPSLTIKIK